VSSFSDIFASMKRMAEGVLPSMQAFPPIDVAALSANLRINKRAQEHAAQERPTSSSQFPDDVELDIEDELDRRARKATEEYQAQRDLYDGRIRGAVVSGDQRVLVDAAGENAIADFKAETLNNLNRLHVLQEHVAQSESEFREFRSLNNLTRPARINEHGGRTWLVLALIIVGESILNGQFFAQGSEAGMIGGVIQAVVLSALNVGAATLYAFWLLPQLFHRRFSRKALGILGSLLFLLWLGFLNLAIGHFRDLFVERAGDVTMATFLERLLDAPFALRDVESGLLVMLGIGLGIGAMIKVALFQDLYPGYARLGRRRQDAIDRFTSAQELCLVELVKLRDQAVADMTAAIEAISRAQYELEMAMTGRQRLHNNFVAHLGELSKTHSRLISEYRQANTAHRKTPPPQFFASVAPAPASTRPAELTNPSIVSSDVRQEAVTRIEHYIRAVNKEFETALAAYQSVRDLTSSPKSANAAA
jgi:hypothetical protein